MIIQKRNIFFGFINKQEVNRENLMTDDVITEANQAIFSIILNRPHKKNALTNSMRNKIAKSIIQAEEDPKIRVIMISGNGNSFCAGADISKFSKDTPLESGLYEFDIREL